MRFEKVDDVVLEVLTVVVALVGHVFGRFVYGHFGPVLCARRKLFEVVRGGVQVL